MNIRTRLIWAMVVISLVPLAVLAFSSNLALDEMIAKAGQEAQDALEKEGRQSILQVANAVAGQMRLYLYLHPELDLTDMDAVQRDLGLADIAVQSVGVTGYTAVFDSQGITRFHAQPENIGLDMSTLAEELPDFWGIFEAALDGSPSEGYYEWIDSDGSVRQKFMVIVPVEGTELRVAATTYIDEFAQPVEELSQRLNKAAGGVRLRLLGIGALGVIFAAGMALFFGIRLTSPLRDMAESAEQVAQGDWEAIRVLPERTELGALSRSLYAMTNQLRTTQMNLERDVESRTSELSRRTGQLEAAAEVAREAAAIRNLDELLTQVTLLIFERFKFYHVGIFLVDEARKYVILRAANSEGGKRMLQRGYQLRLGQEGIVGWVANAGRPRVAFDVGADRQYFKNPDLPQTRSEAALPLRIRERVIGVLDVQSTESSAFVPEDIGVLQIMADQIALAVENTRLFEETQQTIQAMNRLYGQQTQEAWQKYLSEHPVAFRYTRIGVEQAATGDLIEFEQEKSIVETGADYQDLIVPIVSRGQTIGHLRLRRDAQQAAWSEADITLVEQALAQILPAIENARLLEEVQIRAAREQAVNVITSRVRSTISMDSIMQNAVRELALALGASRTFVQVGMEQASSEDRTDQGS